MRKYEWDSGSWARLWLRCAHLGGAVSSASLPTWMLNDGAARDVTFIIVPRSPDLNHRTGTTAIFLEQGQVKAAGPGAGVLDQCKATV